jgi:drug/metabolite transporter (DMT)-like permease
MPGNTNRTPPADASTRAYVLLTLTTLCWGANAVFGRLAVGEISPMLLVALRWLGTVGLLLLFAGRHIRRDWPVLKCHLPFLAAMGAIGFTAFNGLFYVAAHSTTAVNIGIIQGSMPVFVLIGAFLAYRSPVTLLQAAGVVLTMVGVVIVGTGGSLERLATLAINHGDLLMIIACVFYSSYAVGLRNQPPVSSLGLLTVLAAAAFVFSLPLVAAEAALGHFQWPTPTGWLVAGLVTLLPSFLSQIFFIQGVTLIGPGRAGVFINLVPVFASILAVAILSEPFELFHALALALVLAGIWLSERAGRA